MERTGPLSLLLQRGLARSLLHQQASMSLLFSRGAPALAALLVAVSASAQELPPDPAPQLPAVLTLQKALEIFRTRGFDLLVAEANVSSAQGDASIASGLPNPSISFSAGKNFRCAQSQDCTVISYSASVSDNSLISNFLTNKRGLRKEVSEAALEAARKSRDDARRTLEYQLKQVYLQSLLAAAQRDVARESRDSNLRTRALNEKRFALGAMSEADLATIQVAELESEQALDTAEQNLRTTKISIGFLLGFRTLVPDFALDASELDFAVPGPFAVSTRESLVKDALERRPDLAALGRQIERARAGLQLARRNRFPDIGVGITWSANGSGDTNISPPNGSIGITVTPPLFYFQGGEIRKAEADFVTQQVLRQKAEAQIVADVETAWAQLTGTKSLVERMQHTLLQRAQTARDLIRVQYEKGAASLLDLLNAQRTYSATRAEYAQDLASYWTAFALLEQATAQELRR